MDFSSPVDPSANEHEKDTCMNTFSEIIVCDPCLFDDTKEEAVGFCWTCVEYLCHSCIKEHKKARMTRKHSMQTHSFPKKAEALRDVKTMITCPFHADMNVTYHCENHDVNVCSICLIDTHTECRNVTNITAVKHGEVFSDIQNELDVISHATKLVRKIRTENITSLHEDQEHIFRQNRSILQEILKMSTDKAKASTETIVQELEKDVQELDEIEKLQIKCQGILEAALKSENKDFAKIVAFMLHEKHQSVKTNVTSLQRKGYRRLDFKSTPQLNELQSLVKVTVIEKDRAITPIEEENCIQNRNETKLADLSEYLNFGLKQTCIKTSFSMPSMEKLESVMSPCVKDVSDTNICSIIGSVLLQTGQLLLIHQENAKLKLLSKSLLILTSLNLSGKPIRMCAIGYDMVAVAFENVRRIHRYKAKSDSVTYEGGFTTRLYTHCIAFNGQNIIAIMSDEDFCSNVNSKEDILELHILHAQTGEVIDIVKDFKAVGKRKWPIKLTNPMALQLTDQNDVLIAEFNRMFCFELVKESSSSRTVAQEKRYYICGKDIPKDDIENIVSVGDNVYICAGSGKVLQLSATNYMKCKMVLSGLGIIISLAVDRRKGQLLVGCEDDDNIHVYGFE